MNPFFIYGEKVELSVLSVTECEKTINTFFRRLQNSNTLETEKLEEERTLLVGYLKADSMPKEFRENKSAFLDFLEEWTRPIKQSLDFLKERENKMNIRLNNFKTFEKESLKGMCDAVINNVLVIHNIRLLEGNNGLFISMPNSKGRDDKYRDIVFPITKEARDQLNNKILEEYSRLTQMEKGIQGKDISVKCNLLNQDYAIKAYASLQVADSIAITGLKVLEGKNGCYVNMPEYKDREGNYHPVANAIDSDFAKLINNKVLEEYKKELELNKNQDRSLEKEPKKESKKEPEKKTTKNKNKSR